MALSISTSFGNIRKVWTALAAIAVWAASLDITHKIIGTAHNGLVLGAGKSDAYLSLGGVADKNAIEFYFTDAAASGTIRGNYTRLKLTGGAGGEAGRFFCTVENNAPVDTVNGAHNSLSFGASAGNVTGLGNAQRCTLHIPNRSLTGTTSAVMAEIFCDGASSDLGGVTSFFRAAAAGTQGGIDKFDDKGYAFSFQGLTAGAAHVFRTGITAATMNAACTAALRIRIGGTDYFIPLATATA